MDVAGELDALYPLWLHLQLNAALALDVELNRADMDALEAGLKALSIYRAGPHQLQQGSHGERVHIRVRAREHIHDRAAFPPGPAPLLQASPRARGERGVLSQGAV